jgi:hypothetical protein
VVEGNGAAREDAPAKLDGEVPHAHAVELLCGLADAERLSQARQLVRVDLRDRRPGRGIDLAVRARPDDRAARAGEQGVDGSVARRALAGHRRRG